MASLHNNMTAHGFDDYPEEDLIGAVRNSNDIPISDDRWKNLRMTQSHLQGVFPTPITYNRFSFECKGVKEYQQSNLVMIKYGIRFQEDINWEEAQTKFRKFLYEKLSISKSSVIIVGIVSGTDTWYIMRSTEELMRALNNVGTEPGIGFILSKYLAVGGAVAVALFLFLKLKR